MTSGEHDHTCGLYLAVSGAPGSSAPDRLAPLLGSAEVECLMITSPQGKAIDAPTALSLCELAHEAGIAVVVRGDAQLARTIKADGVHVDWAEDVQERFAQAREIVGGGAIVGVDVGRSRHDAMCLGEAGADYIAFGIPEHVQDRQKARVRQMELIAWWGQIFEVPCVGIDLGDDDGLRYAACAGADFAVLDLPDGLSGDGLKDWFADRRLEVATIKPEKPE